MAYRDDDDLMSDYCPKCSQYTGGDSFCPNCGAKIYDDSGLQEEEEEKEGDEEENRHREPDEEEEY